MKISAFTITSEPERLCYPYIESIKSWLPLVDELIVVSNCIDEFQDGSLEKIRAINDTRIQIISGVFDYERFGWASQGIMRTNGYYACTGDMVIMFDCDGLLHEQDVEFARQDLERCYKENKAYGYFMKYRIYTPDTLLRQCKHSGWYNKKILGNNFNFYGSKGLYAPNWGIIPKKYEKGQQLDVFIWGYERMFDTEEIFVEKLKKRRIMESSLYEVPSEKEYIRNFLKEVKNFMNQERAFAILEDHPKIIRDKLKSINKDMFGFDLFGMKGNFNG